MHTCTHSDIERFCLRVLANLKTVNSLKYTLYFILPLHLLFLILTEVHVGLVDINETHACKRVSGMSFVLELCMV